jgi:3-phosphoshikimate 1-carboxyvinyltransferase
MANFEITPDSSKQLEGSLILPPSKSHTLRAILFASLADGTSTIESFLESPDTNAMINAVQLLGAKVEVKESTLKITGFNGKPTISDNVIDCGNSGLVLRLIGSIASLIPEYTILTGDKSIRHSRPAKPLLGALSDLGCFAVSSRGDDHAPIIIKGPITKEYTSLDGKDSQPVSGLLIAGAFAPHPIKIQVRDPGEKPWIDLTLSWFKHLNIPYEMQDYTHYQLKGRSKIESFHYKVPGDLSTLAFPVAAALLTKSKITVHNVDLSDIQGDKILFSFLKEMGALFLIDQNSKTLTIEKSPTLEGMKIDLNNCIDALPILAVLACSAKSPTKIFNAAIARKKESDRISSITTELRKMGAIIEEKEDELTIFPSLLSGAHLDTYKDHRIALSLSVASFSAKGPSVIKDIECIEKTYSGFYEDFYNLGAGIKIL